MSTIGFDTGAFSPSDRTSADVHFWMSLAGTITASSGEQVTDVGFQTGAGAVNFGQLEIGVYRVDTLARVATGTVTSTAAGRFTTSITPVSLTAGVVYGVAWRVVSATVSIGLNSIGSDQGYRNDTLTGANALPATWTISGANVQSDFSIFAITAIAGGGSGILNRKIGLTGGMRNLAGNMG